MADHASTAGATVAWVAAHDGDVVPQFWPWVQVVRLLVGADDAASVRALLGDDGSQIAPMVPGRGVREVVTPRALHRVELACYRP